MDDSLKVSNSDFFSKLGYQAVFNASEIDNM